MAEVEVDGRQRPRGLVCPTTVSTWADLIRYVRARLDWSQRRLGEETGVSELSVRRWERDGIFPRNTLTCKIVATFVTAKFSAAEVEALSKGAYLDPPRKVS